MPAALASSRHLRMWFLLLCQRKHMQSTIFHFGGVESFHKDFQERTISYILFWGYDSKSGTRKNINNRHTDYVTRTRFSQHSKTPRTARPNLIVCLTLTTHMMEIRWVHSYFATSRAPIERLHDYECTRDPTARSLQSQEFGIPIEMPAACR